MVILLSIVLYLLLANGSLGQVRFVPNQCHHNLVHHRPLQFCDPRLNIDKAGVVIEVEHENGRIGAPVIHRGHGPELFLASGVPDLHVNSNILDRDPAAEKGGAYGRREFFGIGLGDVLGDQARLADT